MRSRLTTWRGAALLGALACLASSQPALAHEHFYEVVLSGAGSSGSSASGMALVTLDLDLITMRVEASFAGLAGPSSGLQTHCCTVNAGSGTAIGALAQTNPAGFALGVTSGSFDVVYDLTQGSTYTPAFITASGGQIVDGLNALISGAEAGTMYLSITSSTFPNGEIRGFLVEVAEVPEAGTLALMVVGLAGVGARVRRRAAA